MLSSENSNPIVRIQKLQHSAPHTLKQQCEQINQLLDGQLDNLQALFENSEIDENLVCGYVVATRIKQQISTQHSNIQRLRFPYHKKQQMMGMAIYWLVHEYQFDLLEIINKSNKETRFFMGPMFLDGYISTAYFTQEELLHVLKQILFHTDDNISRNHHLNAGIEEWCKQVNPEQIKKLYKETMLSKNEQFSSVIETLLIALVTKDTQWVLEELKQYQPIPNAWMFSVIIRVYPAFAKLEGISYRLKAFEHFWKLRKVLHNEVTVSNFMLGISAYVDAKCISGDEYAEFAVENISNAKNALMQVLNTHCDTSASEPWYQKILRAYFNVGLGSPVYSELEQSVLILLAEKHPQLVVQIYEIWLTIDENHGRKFDDKVRSSVSELYNHHRLYFYSTMAKWLIANRQELQIAASEILQDAGNNRRVDNNVVQNWIVFPEDIIRGFNHDEIFLLIHKLCGYLIHDPSAIFSLAWSALKKPRMPKRCLVPIKYLFCKFMVYNWPSVVESQLPLFENKGSTQQKNMILAVRNSLERYKNIKSSIPQQKELRPPRDVLYGFKKAMNKQQRDIYKQSLEGSFIQQIASTKTVKAGLGSYTEFDDQISGFTPFARIEYSMPMATSFATNQLQFEKDTRIWRQAKLSDIS